MKHKLQVLNDASRHDISYQTGFTVFSKLEGDKSKGLILLADHASNAIPTQYEKLGLPEYQLERHIGYDIGVAGVTQHLSQMLNVPAVMAGFSRLLIDPNRGADDPTLIMKVSDGAIVPGNAYITPEDRKHRLETYYKPYHQAIDDTIDESLAAGIIPVLFSIHSFTNLWKDMQRPWHVTILWDKDPRLARPLLNWLGKHNDRIVGENVPYVGGLEGDCLYTHGLKRGLAHALIEIRQDLIATDEGQQEWAECLAEGLQTLLEDKAVQDTVHKIHSYLDGCA